MNTRTKIISFMFLTLILYGAFVVYLGQFNAGQVRIILNDSKKQKTEQLDKLMNLFTAQQQFLTNDASIWDDTLSFVKTKDRDFSLAYLDSALSIFDVNQLWVYDDNNKLVYTTHSFPDGSSNNFSFSSDVFKQLFIARQAHFFIETSNGIMEIYAATI